jgi:hypothetical protein
MSRSFPDLPTYWSLTQLGGKELQEESHLHVLLHGTFSTAIHYNAQANTVKGNFCLRTFR